MHRNVETKFKAVVLELEWVFDCLENCFITVLLHFGGEKTFRGPFIILNHCVHVPIFQ